MRIVIATAVIGLLFGGSSFAQEQEVRIPVHCPPPVNWTWIVQPDKLQYSLLIGETASSTAKAGDYGVAECEVGKNLHPTNCTALWESPKSNLGEFVIKLSKYYKAASKDQAGQPTEGRKFCFAFGLSGRTGGV
jgi:hypothetical protein